MKSEKKIAALLTCHNRREKTLQSLGLLFEAALPKNYKLNVFLVDDGSTDGTSKAIKKSFPEVNVIRGDGNLYWNGGMNLAWKTAEKEYSYDFFLWLNDDTYILQNALEILLKESELKNNQSIICGKTKSQLTGKVTYGGLNLDNRGFILDNNVIEKCDYFNGNIVLIPRSVFEELGFLETGFVHCLGDYDYGLRAREKNISSWVTAESVAFCENNDLPKWCNPKTPILTRMKFFYTPLGAEPFEYFIYSKRHFGFSVAVRNFVTQHLRMLFPNYWVKKIIHT